MILKYGDNTLMYEIKGLVRVRYPIMSFWSDDLTYMYDIPKHSHTLYLINQWNVPVCSHYPRLL